MLNFEWHMKLLLSTKIDELTSIALLFVLYIFHYIVA